MSEAAGPELTVAIDCRMALHSGIGVVLRSVLPELMLLRPNWTYRLIGAPGGWDTGSLPARTVNLVPLAAPIYSIGEQFGLRLAAAGADLLWSPHYNAGVFAGVPLLTTIHDVTHLAVAEYTRGLAKRFYAKSMYELVRRRSAGLLFVSEFSRREFGRLVGPVRQPSWIAHNAVGADWLSGAPAPVPAFAGDYLVAVGNLKPHKNLGALLQAMTLVRRSFDIRLVIVGKTDGFITADTTSRASAAELGDAVHWTGEVSDAELRGWVAHARALVFPSLYEGFGLPPLEAMALGRPTLVSNAASIPEVCGDASLYFDPRAPAEIASVIGELLGSPELAGDLIRRGASRVRSLSWPATARVMASAMETVAGH